MRRIGYLTKQKNNNLNSFILTDSYPQDIDVHLFSGVFRKKNHVS